MKGRPEIARSDGIRLINTIIYIFLLLPKPFGSEIIYIYSPKTSQIMEFNLEAETEVYIDLYTNGYLDPQAEEAIFNSLKMYTEEEIEHQINKKEEGKEEKREVKKDERREEKREKKEERKQEKREERKPEKREERKPEKRQEKKPEKREERKSQKREERKSEKREEKKPPKEKRELRLGFQSSQLKKRFEEVVKEVPGRKEQAHRIFDFIAMSENGTTTPLCLHGNTGCGKTSLITKVMDFFSSNSKTVSVAYLNCMSMWSANHVYYGILSRLYGVKEKNPSQALHDRLKSGIGNSELTKIIILDQIDQFINDQKFLYNMLEWLWVGAKLILVLISNVIDLTLKLDAKLQSRLKFETTIFKPYSYQQVEEIIYYKYPNIRNLLQKDAVTFVSKKIANINSDIRLLQKMYARMENEFRQRAGKELLNLHVVSALINQQSKLPVGLAPYATILKILHKAGKKEQISHEVMHRLFIQGSKFPESRDVLLMLCDIQDCGLITLTNKKNCDVTYYDYGIKIHEALHLLHGDDDGK